MSAFRQGRKVLSDAEQSEEKDMQPGQAGKMEA
jgi:hypothetical protein